MLLTKMMLEQSGKCGFEELAPKAAPKADARPGVVGPLRKVVRRMVARKDRTKDGCKVLAPKADSAHRSSGKPKPALQQQQQAEGPASDPIVFVSDENERSYLEANRPGQAFTLHRQSGRGKDEGKSLAPKAVRKAKKVMRRQSRFKPAPPSQRRDEPASDSVVFVKDNTATRGRKRKRSEE
eukprot:Rhum_TRINITY_DN9112_c0_g1::Rhum_TRINITY_DN9112_c0_g1_i1::g.31628::m.31628